MSDKTIFGCAETGTYQTSSPNPHIELSGTASSDYSIAQLFADAMSTDDRATISVIKDKDNWAVYSGVKFTNASPDTLDLSVATLQESKGTLSDEDAVTCLGLAPGTSGVEALEVTNGASITTTTSWLKLAFDTVNFDTGSSWDAANKKFVPTRPGYYLFSLRVELSDYVNGNIGVYKNGSLHRLLGHSSTAWYSSQGSALIYMNGTSDYAEFYVRTSAAKTIGVNNVYNYGQVIGPLAT